MKTKQIVKTSFITLLTLSMLAGCGTKKEETSKSSNTTQNNTTQVEEKEVSIAPTEATIKVGKNYTITVTHGDDSIKATSSDDKIASVKQDKDDTFVVTGNKEGKATITLTIDDKTFTSTVTVDNEKKEETKGESKQKVEVKKKQETSSNNNKSTTSNNNSSKNNKKEENTKTTTSSKSKSSNSEKKKTTSSSKNESKKVAATSKLTTTSSSSSTKKKTSTTSKSHSSSSSKTSSKSTKTQANKIDTEKIIYVGNTGKIFNSQDEAIDYAEKIVDENKFKDKTVQRYSFRTANLAGTKWTVNIYWDDGYNPNQEYYF